MSVEFVVFDADGYETDWVDPVKEHFDLGGGKHQVDNGYDIFDLQVPEGGRFEIRAMEVSK